MPGLPDHDLLDAGSSRRLNEIDSRILIPRRQTEDDGPLPTDRSQSCQSSITSSIAPISTELGDGKSCQPMTGDWPTQGEKNLEAAFTEACDEARLRRLEGDLRRLDCEGYIAHLRKGLQASLAEMRRIAAQLEAAIADCRHEQETQREQLLLLAVAALKAEQRVARDAVRESSQDAPREDMREAAWESAGEDSREVMHSRRASQGPYVAAAEIQEPRGKMQDAEHKLSEVASLARQSESTYVSRDELHNETRRVRIEVQAIQQDHSDKLAIIQGQIAQASLLAGAKEQGLVPEVTTKAFGDMEGAFAESHYNKTQLSEAQEDVPKPVASELSAATALGERDEEVPRLRRALEETSRSMSQLVQGFEARLDRAEQLASTDRAGVADLRSMLEEALRALTKEVAQERIERCTAVNEVASRSDLVTSKTRTLIDEITEARWNGLIVGHERSASDDPNVPGSVSLRRFAS